MVTPYLVKPTDEKKIALPTDGYSPASDADILLRGRSNSVYGNNARPSVFGGQAGIQGPVGFVMK
jgi:pilus assembly protein CpaC